MGTAMTERDIQAVVREVTDEEVAFYHEYGWVMMKKLVDPDFSRQILHTAREWVDGDGSTAERPHVHLALEGVEPLRSFMFSERMANNATRLVDRKRLKGVDDPLCYRIDMLVRKDPGAAGSTYHQDSAEHGSDRVGELQFWLALAAVTPDRGAMRFVNHSHREGPLGSVFNDDKGDLLEQFPNLTSVLELSPPLYYEPGDCTVHHGYTVHGGPPNSTDETRWSYLFSYSPADTRYWNGTAANWGSERKRLSDPDNPHVPRPDSEV
ncbi:MAG: phytanoyl-CoA dioxygenase family protein [Candidatus Latescibacterota bacterium]|jgi:hypothetical protein|nr:phytanoyl-CoA dioxygenase family protein [Candidatus Latescibacterota bacterium]MEC8992524.1 phytanoyl-CoA dioxygenase family protein [Candidatus Latescibacterota bacterium]MEE3040877.1 phytanoyl-CoA dioxygenase family protein [Candidatus Latescibacterota bacterium]